MFYKKGVLLILDGLGDRPVPLLGRKTPLEAAKTPILDRLSESGMTGFVTHILPGVPVGTQTGSGLLLGLAPADVGKLSRGLVQAIGAGITLKEGDVALRCNFATLRWGKNGVEIVDRRAGRISAETDVLAQALGTVFIEEEVEIFVKASTQHRVALVIRGRGLGAAISNTDPGSGNEAQGLLRCRPIESRVAANVRTAEIVNTFLEKAHVVLRDHPVNRVRESRGLLPANGLITRGAGRLEMLNNLLQHLQIRTMVVSGEGTLHGLGKLFGFDVDVRPGFTATTNTDLEGKVSAAIEALNDHDLVVLHVKAPDVCAHDRDPIRKKTIIEAIDAAIKPLAKMDLVIGVTADHSTDSTTGRHTGDPVPSLIYSADGRKDEVEVFGESACLHGGLRLITPMGFLCTMLDQMNRTQNFNPWEYNFFS